MHIVMALFVSFGFSLTTKLVLMMADGSRVRVFASYECADICDVILFLRLWDFTCSNSFKYNERSRFLYICVYR